MFTLLNLNDAVAAAATPSDNDRRRTQSASSSSSSSSSSSTLTDVAAASKQKRRPSDKEEHVVDADVGNKTKNNKHQSVPIFEEFMHARKDAGPPARPEIDNNDEEDTDVETVNKEEEEEESESDNLQVLKRLLQSLEKQEKKKTGKNGEASVGGKEKKSAKASVNDDRLPSTSAHGGKKEKNSRPEATNAAVRKSSTASSGFRPHSLGLSLASKAVASRAKKTPVGRSVAGLIKTYAAFAGHIAGIQQYLEDLDNATANKEH